MKNNGQVTQVENNFDASCRIVSSTTEKGVITFVNADFVKISGFSEEELMGQAHNVVRHADMPQAAFKDLWDTAKQQKSWMGVVKNRCKNGDHYWVDAFVTPMTEAGETVGFQSVRLKPNKETVSRAEQLYSDINRGKSWFGIFSGMFSSLKKKLILASVFSILLGFLVSRVVGMEITVGTLSFIGTVLISLILSMLAISRPWEQAARDSLAIFDNAVARKIYTGRNDELGQLQLALKFLEARNNTIIWRTSEEISHLHNVAKAASDVTSTTESNMNALHMEVDMVSTAMTEMTATVQEVAQSAANTSLSTQEANNQVNEGHEVVSKTKDIIMGLTEKMETSSNVIQSLADNSDAIGSVVDVINSIAEQTNLLALNAAIEAARAGELGRGFAVVADEVRSLAGKTQSSTGEISAMITSLQSTAKNAVDSMDESTRSVSECVEEAERAVQVFDTIITNVNTINDMSTQIATAAEEQTLVSSEIDQNIINIGKEATNTLTGCQLIKASNGDLLTSIQKLDNMAAQFSR